MSRTVSVIKPNNLHWHANWPRWLDCWEVHMGSDSKHWQTLTQVVVLLVCRLWVPEDDVQTDAIRLLRWDWTHFIIWTTAESAGDDTVRQYWREELHVHVHHGHKHMHKNWPRPQQHNQPFRLSPLWVWHVLDISQRESGNTRGHNLKLVTCSRQQLILMPHAPEANQALPGLLRFDCLCHQLFPPSCFGHKHLVSYSIVAGIQVQQYQQVLWRPNNPETRLRDIPWRSHWGGCWKCHSVLCCTENDWMNSLNETKLNWMDSSVHPMFTQQSSKNLLIRCWHRMQILLPLPGRHAKSVRLCVPP